MPIFNPATSRYEQSINGNTVFATVTHEGGTLTIMHVEAAPALRGTGAAGVFMQGLIQQLRREGITKVIPSCGYAASWLTRHTGYADMQ